MAAWCSPRIAGFGRDTAAAAAAVKERYGDAIRLFASANSHECREPGALTPTAAAVAAAPAWCSFPTAAATFRAG